MPAYKFFTSTMDTNNHDDLKIRISLEKNYDPSFTANVDEMAMRVYKSTPRNNHKRKFKATKVVHDDWIRF
jgi:hypothetical protein